jgi:hypothetical protein
VRAARLNGLAWSSDLSPTKAVEMCFFVVPNGRDSLILIGAQVSFDVNDEPERTKKLNQRRSLPRPFRQSSPDDVGQAQEQSSANPGLVAAARSAALFPKGCGFSISVTNSRGPCKTGPRYPVATSTRVTYTSLFTQRSQIARVNSPELNAKLGQRCATFLPTPKFSGFSSSNRKGCFACGS